MLHYRSQKLENVSIALEFLEREGITLVNIDSTDIVDCKLKLILGNVTRLSKIVEIFENFNPKILLIKIQWIVFYYINFHFLLNFDHFHNFFHIFTKQNSTISKKYSGHSNLRFDMDLDSSLCYFHAYVGWASIGCHGSRKNSQAKTYGLGQG